LKYYILPTDNVTTLDRWQQSQRIRTCETIATRGNSTPLNKRATALLLKINYCSAIPQIILNSLVLERRTSNIHKNTRSTLSNIPTTDKIHLQLIHTITAIT